jgi:hypothetical protein
MAMSVQSAITDEVAYLGAASGVLSAETIGSRTPRNWRHGRVTAVFDRACHIATQDGGFLAILSADAGNVGHGIRLKTRPCFDACLPVGALVTFDGSRIRFAPQAIVIDLSGAEVWRSPLRPGLVDPASNLSHSAARAKHLVTAAAKGSTSEFLKLVLRIDCPPTPLVDLVRRQLAPLAAAQSACDHASAMRALGSLIGLGPGLTPAGDDFIIGWLAGLTLSAATAEAEQFLRQMCEGVAVARHATTVVSAQHLDDACHLCFSERLSNLCLAIGRGLPDAALSALIDRQLAIGASSGADAAAGLFFALADLERRLHSRLELEGPLCRHFARSSRVNTGIPSR